VVDLVIAISSVCVERKRDRERQREREREREREGGRERETDREIRQQWMVALYFAFLPISNFIPLLPALRAPTAFYAARL